MRQLRSVWLVAGVAWLLVVAVLAQASEAGAMTVPDGSEGDGPLAGLSFAAPVRVKPVVPIAHPVPPSPTAVALPSW